MNEEPQALDILRRAALRDAIPRERLAVTNNAGDKWTTGDGTLNVANLRIMQKAVARSVYDRLAGANERPTPPSTLHGAVEPRRWREP